MVMKPPFLIDWDEITQRTIRQGQRFDRISHLIAAALAACVFGLVLAPALATAWQGV